MKKFRAAWFPVLVFLLLVFFTPPVLEARAPTAPGDENWDARFTGAVGLNDSVNVTATDGTNLYAGGYFTRADEVTVNHIARWDGAAWHALGNGTNGEVNAIVVVGDALYVGGDFTLADGIVVNHVAKWDGTHWSALGEGVNDRVNAIPLRETLFLSAVSFPGQATRARAILPNGTARIGSHLVREWII